MSGIKRLVRMREPLTHEKLQQSPCWKHFCRASWDKYVLKLRGGSRTVSKQAIQTWNGRSVNIDGTHIEISAETIAASTGLPLQGEIILKGQKFSRKVVSRFLGRDPWPKSKHGSYIRAELPKEWCEAAKFLIIYITKEAYDQRLTCAHFRFLLALKGEDAEPINLPAFLADALSKSISLAQREDLPLFPYESLLNIMFEYAHQAQQQEVKMKRECVILPHDGVAASELSGNTVLVARHRNVFGGPSSSCKRRRLSSSSGTSGEAEQEQVLYMHMEMETQKLVFSSSDDNEAASATAMQDTDDILLKLPLGGKSDNIKVFGSTCTAATSHELLTQFISLDAEDSKNNVMLQGAKTDEDDKWVKSEQEMILLWRRLCIPQHWLNNVNPSLRTLCERQDNKDPDPREDV